MRFDPDKHHRRSIRLKGYDYSQAGAYFVTICTKDRGCLFGEIIDGEMVLNPFGEVVQACWDDLPRHYPHVELDAFVIMPNHLHGIIIIRRGEAFVPSNASPQHPEFQIGFHTQNQSIDQHRCRRWNCWNSGRLNRTVGKRL